VVAADDDQRTPQRTLKQDRCRDARGERGPVRDLRPPTGHACEVVDPGRASRPPQLLYGAVTCGRRAHADHDPAGAPSMATISVEPSARSATPS
jgi:hypothetical protein